MLFKRKLKKPLKIQSRLLKNEKESISKGGWKMSDLQNYIAKRKVRDAYTGTARQKVENEKVSNFTY